MHLATLLLAYTRSLDTHACSLISWCNYAFSCVIITHAHALYTKHTLRTYVCTYVRTRTWSSVYTYTHRQICTMMLRISLKIGGHLTCSFKTISAGAIFILMMVNYARLQKLILLIESGNWKRFFVSDTQANTWINKTVLLGIFRIWQYYYI